MKNCPLAQIIVPAMFAIFTCGCYLSNQRVPPTVSPDFNERVFLVDAPCPAPCWYGLEIGQSTEREVTNTISTLNFIDQKTVRIIPQSIPDMNSENWVEGKEIIATCVNRREPCLHLGVANDKLRDILIELDFGLTVGEVIKHFGEPEYTGYEDIGGDVIDCQMVLIWQSKQIVLYSTVFSKTQDVNDYCYTVSKSGIVDANVIIKEVRYLPLTDIHIKIENDRFVEYIETK